MSSCSVTRFGAAIGLTAALATTVSAETGKGALVPEVVADCAVECPSALLAEEGAQTCARFEAEVARLRTSCAVDPLSDMATMEKIAMSLGLTLPIAGVAMPGVQNGALQEADTFAAPVDLSAAETPTEVSARAAAGPLTVLLPGDAPAELPSTEGRTPDAFAETVPSSAPSPATAVQAPLRADALPADTPEEESIPQLTTQQELPAASYDAAQDGTEPAATPLATTPPVVVAALPGIEVSDTLPVVAAPRLAETQGEGGEETEWGKRVTVPARPALPQNGAAPNNGVDGPALAAERTSGANANRDNRVDGQAVAVGNRAAAAAEALEAAQAGDRAASPVASVRPAKRSQAALERAEQRAAARRAAARAAPKSAPAPQASTRKQGGFLAWFQRVTGQRSAANDVVARADKGNNGYLGHGGLRGADVRNAEVSSPGGYADSDDEGRSDDNGNHRNDSSSDRGASRSASASDGENSAGKSKGNNGDNGNHGSGNNGKGGSGNNGDNGNHGSGNNGSNGQGSSQSNNETAGSGSRGNGKS